MKFASVCLAVCMMISCGKKESDLSHYWNEFDEWGHLTGILDYPVPGHGTDARIIYANKISQDPVTNTPGRIIRKKGSVLVKEHFKNADDARNDKNPIKVYIMIKDPEDPRALNGWIYVVQPEGKKYTVNTTRMCVGCHEAANEKHMYFDKNETDSFRDYLFSPVQSHR